MELFNHKLKNYCDCYVFKFLLRSEDGKKIDAHAFRMKPPFSDFSGAGRTGPNFACNYEFLVMIP